jgi:hypothetical protein
MLRRPMFSVSEFLRFLVFWARRGAEERRKPQRRTARIRRIASPQERPGQIGRSRLN